MIVVLQTISIGILVFFLIYCVATVTTFGVNSRLRAIDIEISIEVMIVNGYHPSRWRTSCLSASTMPADRR